MRKPILSVLIVFCFLWNSL